MPTLYLIIERPRRRAWRGCQIVKVTKKKPMLRKPSEQALICLHVCLPEKLLEPRAVVVEVKPEHIVTPVATVTSQPVP